MREDIFKTEESNSEGFKFYKPVVQPKKMKIDQVFPVNENNNNNSEFQVFFHNYEFCPLHFPLCLYPIRSRTMEECIDQYLRTILATIRTIQICMYTKSRINPPNLDNYKKKNIFLVGMKYELLKSQQSTLC